MIDLQELLGKIKPHVLGWAHPDWADWTPTLVGFSANPSPTIHRYRLVGKTCELAIRHLNAGTSNATTFTISLPFTAATITNHAWIGHGYAYDNGVLVSTLRGQIGSAGTTLIFSTTFGGGVWTASGNKFVPVFSIVYEIA